MAVLSGKYVEALIASCTIAEFESIDLTYGANIHEYNSRAGGGATKTVEGVFSGSGTLNGFLDPTDPLTSQLTSGALVALIIRESQGSQVVASGNVRLGQFNLPTMSRSGEPIQVSIPFVTDGVIIWNA